MCLLDQLFSQKEDTDKNALPASTFRRGKQASYEGEGQRLHTASAQPLQAAKENELHHDLCHLK